MITVAFGGFVLSAAGDTNLLALVKLIDGKTMTLQHPRNAYVGGDGNGYSSPKWQGGAREDVTEEFLINWSTYEFDEQGRPKVDHGDNVKSERLTLRFAFTNVTRIARVQRGAWNVGWNGVDKLEVNLKDGSKTLISRVPQTYWCELSTVSPAGEITSRKVGGYALTSARMVGYLDGKYRIESGTSWRAISGDVLDSQGIVTKTNHCVFDWEIKEILFSDRSKPFAEPESAADSSR